MEKIAVLGAGMVGRTIALDLSKDYNITSFDINVSNLLLLYNVNREIQIYVCNLSEYGNYERYFKDFDYVVSAVPGFMGYNVLKKLIECGKNVCDISFFPEDPLSLDNLAKEKNVTVITDMGVAPGMSNLILGRYNEIMEVKDFKFYVGGLPKYPKEPLKYKAPFSPIDVIEEYTRPARMKQNGDIVTKPALSERILIGFEQTGDLEGFNTDGLRTLLDTMKHIPNMMEKTLRYKGHLDFMINLKECGFFNDNEIQFGDKRIKPIEITSQLLVNEWKYGVGEQDITIMKIIINGVKDSRDLMIECDLYDEYDEIDQLSSMSRTTGYVCSSGINLIIKNIFNGKGVFPPELIGKNTDYFYFVMKYLTDRKVHWKIKAH